MCAYTHTYTYTYTYIFTHQVTINIQHSTYIITHSIRDAGKTMFGEEESYFFTPRDRKYPNGGRPNRTAASGYWKATGTDQPIRSSFGSRMIGVKKALVFYQGRPPSGIRMDWIMTEYRLPDTSRPSRSTGSMRVSPLPLSLSLSTLCS